MTNQEYLIGVMNDVETIRAVLQRVVESVVSENYVGDNGYDIVVENGVLGNQLWIDVCNSTYDGNDGILAWEFNVNRNGTTSNVMWHDNVAFGLSEFRDTDEADDEEVPLRIDIMSLLDAELRAFDWASHLKVLSIEFHTNEVA